MNEFWGTVSMNELLWCDVEWNIMIRLLIEPDIFSPYGGTFDTFRFPFYCDSELAMKFNRVLGQFLVRSTQRLLQNISKWLFPYLMAASLFWFVRWDLQKILRNSVNNICVTA